MCPSISHLLYVSSGMEKLGLEPINVRPHLPSRRLLINFFVGILLRDEHARDKLRREVGDDMFKKLGIVM